MYELDYIIGKPLEPIRDILYKDYLTYLCEDGIRLTAHKKSLAKNAVSCFILNSYKTHSRGLDRVYLTLQESNYSNAVVVNGRPTDRKVSYTYHKKLLQFLYNNAYIDLLIGGVEEYKLTRCSGKVRLKPSSKSVSYATILEPLDKLYNEVGWSKEQYKSNVLFLKDKDKDIKTFRLDDTLRDKRDYLRAFNKFCVSFDVTREDTKYDVQMYKVYSGTTQKGGRTYMNGSIQQLSSQEREDILIDGKPVTGYDYVSFETSLAYSACQEIMEGDAYSIVMDGYDESVLRKICKYSLMIMLNSKSKVSAKTTINKIIKDSFDIEDLHRRGFIPDEWVHTNHIMQRLESKHHKISQMLYRENSYDLQYIGSLINDYVVDYMMQQHGVLVLQIHDGFIVQEEHGELLYDCMVKGYETIFGFSDNCIIKKEF